MRSAHWRVRWPWPQSRQSSVWRRRAGRRARRSRAWWSPPAWCRSTARWCSVRAPSVVTGRRAGDLARCSLELAHAATTSATSEQGRPTGGTHDCRCYGSTHRRATAAGRESLSQSLVWRAHAHGTPLDHRVRPRAGEGLRVQGQRGSPCLGVRPALPLAHHRLPRHHRLRRARSAWRPRLLFRAILDTAIPEGDRDARRRARLHHRAASLLSTPGSASSQRWYRPGSARA